MAWTIESTSPNRGLDNDVSREREMPPGGGFADLLAREEAPRPADERRPLAARDDRDDARDDVRRSDEVTPAVRDEDDATQVARRREGAEPRAAIDDAARDMRPPAAKAASGRRASTVARPQQAGAQTEPAVTPAVEQGTNGTVVAASAKTTIGGTSTTASTGAAGPIVLPLFAAAIVAPTTAGGATTSTSASTKSTTAATTTAAPAATNGPAGATTQPAPTTPALAAAMAALAGTGGAATQAPNTPAGATGSTSSTSTTKPAHSTAAAALTATASQPAEAWLRTLALASGQGQTATDGNDGEPAGQPAARAVATLGLDPAALEGGGRAAPTTDGGAAIAKAAEPTPPGPSRALCEALGQLATRFDDLPPGASRVAQMTVRLTPEGFGSVELGVRLQAGVVHVVVRCESERTARALRAETGALRRAFAGTKLELDGVDIETMAGGAGRSTVAASEDSAGAESLV